MPSLRITVAPQLVGPGVLDLDALRAEVGAPQQFSTEALAEAAAAAAAPRLPTVGSAASAAQLSAADRTDLPLLTIDPPGSMDLDQALHLEQRGDGYRVWYAISDPAAFVDPGSTLDAELHARGLTLYAPDRRIPLHPPVLGEGAASLLPGVDRPAVLWRLDLDAAGALVTSQVERALVRSRQRLDYAQVEASLATDAPPPVLLLLRTIGRLRQALGLARGAVDLATPEQEVQLDADGRPRLSLRAQLPSEGWNAQLSLLTGMAAAALMLAGGIGLLRTLPEPDPATVVKLRRSALALDVPWPQAVPYGEVISGLDPSVPAHAALLTLATRLLRGAGYTAFDVAAAVPAPADPRHSAVAAPYAHCTAPLRRLADRWVSEVCLALCAGTPVPEWAREGLPALPAVMDAANHRASALDRAVVDAAEALVLAGRIGQEFDAVVVATRAGRGTVQLREPPVRASCTGASLPLGERVRVRLDVADPARREVRFALLPDG